MDWLIEAALNFFLKSIVDDAISLLTMTLANLSAVTQAVLDMPLVVAAIGLSQAIAISMLTPKVVLEIWYNNMLRQQGDSSGDVAGTLIRSATAVAMIGLVPWLVTWTYKWGTFITVDVAQLPGVDINDPNSGVGDKLTMFYQSLLQIGLLGPVIMTFCVAIFILVMLQAAVRSIEIARLSFVGALLALELSSGSSSGFSAWFKELVAVSVTHAMQLVLIKLSFLLVTGVSGVNPIVSVLLFAAAIWVTYKTPASIKQYVHSTGVGSAIGNVGMSIGNMLMRRAILRR